MKFRKICTTIASLLLLATAAFSQNMPTAQPFFFPKGIQQTTDLLRQREEYMHIFQATALCNQGGLLGTTIPGSDSISVVTGGTTAPLSTLAKTGVIMPPGDYLLLLSQLGPSTGLNALLESPDGAMQVFDGVSGPMWESSAVVRVTLTP